MIKRGTSVLYISYDGVLESLGRSQVLSYIKGLSKHEIGFVLLSFEKKHLLDDAREFGATRKELEGHGIDWIPLRYHKGPTIPAKAFDVLQGIIIGGYIIFNRKIRIIHARSYVPAFIGLVLKTVCRVKFVFDMRGFWIDERVEIGSWTQGGLLYRIAKQFERLFLMHADRIVVLTRAARKEIRSFEYMRKNNIPIVVIPTCVDLESFRYMPGDGLRKRLGLKGKLVFVYSGVISWLRLREMLDFFAIARVHLSSPYFLFLITHGEEKLKMEIAKTIMSPHEYSIHHIPHREMFRWLSLGDAAVVFIDRPLSRKGTCPTKLGEYLACGLPIIINSGIGDVDDIITQNNVGVIIGEFTNKEYMRALDKVRHMLDKKENTRDRSRRVAKKLFDLNRIGIARYMKMYENLLKQ